ncbi:amidohydrolase family protein [Rhodohalobacter mucosus]|uniref:Amidohydrolase n=1 Tax=Rhodohalobacter mucosus TaxID=2079485 RepID=A0A316TX81_9BACT|nr:amidohydrolase family protein [Rhodohalobacter mucosus]PWN08039.1 amidohydrolase [Rhodohalobacter mucosus]
MIKSLNKTAAVVTLLAAAVLFAVPEADAQIAVKGETVYTMDGAPISNGVVLIRDGKIERVGSASRVRIPDDYEVYEAEVVTPGLIDARSVVGLAGYYNQDHDQDQLETSNAVQPELRAVDAYNAREHLVGYLREQGITTLHTGHGPGAVISGQTMIVKTKGETVDEALLDESTMLSMTLGSGISGRFSSPGTRSKTVSVLRQELIKARDYAEKRAEGETNGTDLKMEVLADLIDGDMTAMVMAHRAHDIMTALRIQREFGFPMVLEGASEAYLVMDEIREAGVPVIIHPKMIRPGGEAKHSSMETAGKLHEAGIHVVFQSGYEGYVPKTRVARYEAAIAAANGMGMENALQALTLGAAELLGVDDRVGSLERGKDADVVLFDGDPFEYLTHVKAVIIDGEVVHSAEE